MFTYMAEDDSRCCNISFVLYDDNQMSDWLDRMVGRSSSVVVFSTENHGSPQLLRFSLFGFFDLVSQLKDSLLSAWN